MSAVSCCSGGVMFVPDDIEHEVKGKSYKDFAKEEGGERKRRKLFGRAKKVENQGQDRGSAAA